MKCLSDLSVYLYFSNSYERVLLFISLANAWKQAMVFCHVTGAPPSRTSVSNRAIESTREKLTGRIRKNIRGMRPFLKRWKSGKMSSISFAGRLDSFTET
ncbi:hypothetical protein CEXT_647561 [Caerostris extrusa]|uniref:Uncharacterized protein n=1 Tax=Caerostris extrusa TaxID=172846 RepID=A0AAV4Y2F3_CAEEX|nr:hypothetical protein CEXT_647561 [Caerostris extrusa]